MTPGSHSEPNVAALFIILLALVVIMFGAPALMWDVASYKY